MFVLCLDKTNLATGVGVTQDVILCKVTVGRKDDNVKDHGDSTKELLEGARIRGLEEIQKKLDHFKYTLGGVSPPSLEANLLELQRKLGVGCCRCKCY